MGRRLRRGEGLAIIVVLAGILVITFWPTRIDAPVDGTLSRILTHLHAGGVPTWFDYAFVETGANVVLFIPLGALIASVVMPSLWWASGLLGLTVSLVIEFSQALFLTARQASPSDLAANTAGALLGGLLLAIVRADRNRRSRKDGAGKAQESRVPE